MSSGQDIADRHADVTLSEPELLAKGFRDYLRYRLTLATRKDGAVQQTRDFVLSGKVIAVLPLD